MTDLKSLEILDTRSLFTCDCGLQDLLAFLLPELECSRLQGVLERWESHLPHWQALSDEAARPEKLPRVEKYDRVGNRVERIILPLETRTLRREVVEQGIFYNHSEVEKFAKIYLLAQLGEAGVTCPLACTDGLMRVLQAKGSAFLKTNYLPLLSSPAYPLAGAQFVTEQAGGSDVAAITGKAVRDHNGAWQLFCEKWYCSAVDEFFTVVARPEGAPEGTEGLALFFVPRLLADRPNQLSIRRLKDKLGTQSLPTAEIDFEGATAYLIGEEQEGFANLMNYVINTSRIHNAANSLAFLRRAFAEARNYASQRVAFGKTILHYPLVQEALIKILARLASQRLLYFSMLAGIDQHGLIPSDHDTGLWQRFLINLMKYRTAATLSDSVKEAMLVYGANGIVNDFSILPRLLRDSLIIETWEGTHNTLCLQVLRDSARFDFWGELQKKLQATLKEWSPHILTSSRALYQDAWHNLSALNTQQQLIPLHARRIVDLIGTLLEVGALVRQGIVQRQGGLLMLASYATHTALAHPHGQFKNPVLKSLSRIGQQLIDEEPLTDINLENF